MGMKVSKLLQVVDCVREMTTKKSCTYSEYGSFELLLFCFFDTEQGSEAKGDDYLLSNHIMESTS